MAGDEGSSDGVRSLSLLASAISGRVLQVAPGEPGGEPTWTNGSVVFVDANLSTRDQVDAIAVQAALLAAGSLDPVVVRRLTRRPARARRYLAVEGHRALAAVEGILPPSVRLLLDHDVAARADSPFASLAAALSQETIADPPDTFGVIRARDLLKTLESASRSVTKRQHVPSVHPNGLLAEVADDEDDDGTARDPFSSPVGGGGALGRFLGKFLEMVRQLSGGPPGVDPPTHRARRGTGGGKDAFATGMAGVVEEEAAPERRGTKYAEWDVHRRRYRLDWCTVQEVDPRPEDAVALPPSDGCGLRRPLARLGVGLDRYHRQAQGDDVDIDAAIESRVQVMAGAAPDEAFYVDSLRRRRDLAVLLLLDVSGSAAEPGSTGKTVHEQQRAVAAALTTALHEMGDRVALYGFHSRGRSAVHLVPVKRFDEACDTLVMQRLHSLVPGAYSRLGAAIRHGAAVLNDRGGTSRRLLVVLSDGLAYDHGYEPAYGAADARRALAEARRHGVGCLCLSVGASTDPEALRRVFGSAAHATIPMPAQVGRAIGPLFRSALRSAELRRRMSS